MAILRAKLQALESDNRTKSRTIQYYITRSQADTTSPHRNESAGMGAMSDRGLQGMDRQVLVTMVVRLRTLLEELTCRNVALEVRLDDSIVLAMSSCHTTRNK